MVPFRPTSGRNSEAGKGTLLDVYVRPLSGHSQAIRVSRDGGGAPRWSASGRELFFAGPLGRLTSAPFDGSPGAPRVLFQAVDAVSFEPSPAGDRFLVHLEEHTGQPDPQLLVNWPAPLEEGGE